MLKKRFFSLLKFSTFIILLVLFVSSCTPKITKEQEEYLRKLRQDERALIEQIQAKNKEKKSLETEINARKSELSNCQKEKESLQKLVNQWPNVWPVFPEEEEKK